MSERWVESHTKLNIQKLHQVGALEPHQARIVPVKLGGNAGKVKIEATRGYVTIQAVEGLSLRFSVRLEWTPCHFGGVRPWFVCPDCNERAGVLLYDSNQNGFFCRRCLGLTYQSQSESPQARKQRKQKKRSLPKPKEAPPTT